MLNFPKLVLLFIALSVGLQQDASIEYKKLSYELCYEYTTGKCSSGTGFFLNYRNKLYLVSAWHVFSGINMNTNRPIVEGYPLPTKTRAGRLEKTGFEVEYFNVVSINHQPLYFSAGSETYIYDLAVLPIEPGRKRDYIDWSDNWLNYSGHINDKVFYYGYPVINGNIDQKPQFYAGKITGLPTKGQPYFASDLESYIGCSGAPVFTRQGNKAILIGTIIGKDISKKIVYVVPLTTAWKKIHF